MILLVDNYDSFVFNLARYLRRLGQATQVVRNTAVDLAAVEKLEPDALVISPGPCAPSQAGCSLELARHLCGRLPILGICLGHQVIAEALGGRIKRAREPVHGRASPIHHAGRGVFAGLPAPLAGGRYHSLIVDETAVPVNLEVTAWTEDGTIMALEHRRFPVVGLQFHPESILTQFGFALLDAFLQRAGLPATRPLPTIEQELPAP
jgi:anthranilate synthase component 2/para-aminobenzoate synthetase component 2